MSRSLIVSALLSGIAAVPAHALEFGNGFTASADVEVEYLSSDFLKENVGFGVFDLAYQPAGSAFGGFLGFDTVAFQGLNINNFYGGLSYSGNFGTVQIGAPRPVLNDYFAVPDVGGFRIYSVELPIGKSLIGTLVFFDDFDTPAGIRYDGTFGALKTGASYHAADGIKAANLAGSYTFGKTVVSAGVEDLSGDGGYNLTVTHLAAETSFSKVRLGAALSDFSDFGTTLSQIYATYNATPNLALTGSVLIFDASPFTQEIYGLSGRYAFNNSIFFEAGIIGSEMGESAYNLSVGAKF